MRVLFLGEKTIGNLSVIRLIESSYPNSIIVLEGLNDFNGRNLSESYDICLIDGKMFNDTSPNSLRKLSFISGLPILFFADKEHSMRKFIGRIDNVRGVIKYESGVDFFLSAINIVCAGGYCYSWDVYSMKGNHSALLDEEYCESVGLTRREIEVLKMYLDGDTNKEISIKLSRSQKTISAHKSNILRKIGNKRLSVTPFNIGNIASNC